MLLLRMLVISQLFKIPTISSLLFLEPRLRPQKLWFPSSKLTATMLKSEIQLPTVILETSIRSSRDTNMLLETTQVTLMKLLIFLQAKLRRFLEILNLCLKYSLIIVVSMLRELLSSLTSAVNKTIPLKFLEMSFWFIFLKRLLWRKVDQDTRRSNSIDFWSLPSSQLLETVTTQWKFSARSTADSSKPWLINRTTTNAQRSRPTMTISETRQLDHWTLPCSTTSSQLTEQREALPNGYSQQLDTPTRR